MVKAYVVSFPMKYDIFNHVWLGCSCVDESNQLITNCQNNEVMIYM